MNGIWHGFAQCRFPLILLALLLCPAAVAARYWGGEGPKKGCDCAACQPCNESSACGCGISLSEGNLSDGYSGPTVQSARGPTLHFSLRYDSYNADGSRARIDTVAGIGWTHSYNVFLYQVRGHLFRIDEQGRLAKYKLGPGGTFSAAPGYFETLVRNPDGSYTLTQKDKTRFDFATIPNTPFTIGTPLYRLTRITDRNMNVTTLTYALGQLTEVTDPYGRKLRFTYNAGNKLASVADPLNRVTSFQYNANYTQLLRLTDPEGKSVRYTYNSLWQITGKTDKDGRVFDFGYLNQKPVSIRDGAGRLIYSLSNPTNWATNETVLAMDMLRVYVPSTTTKTDGRGNSWKYDYDERGYLTKIVAPDGATNRITYDPATLLPASETDANLNPPTTYQYDARGNLLRKIDALGHQTTYTYEPAFNRMTSATDANERVTAYVIDPANGNRLKETDPLLKFREWTYDDAHGCRGYVRTERDKNGNVTTYEHDAFCNRVKTTEATGRPEQRVTTYQYDAVGNLRFRTDANGHVTEYQYDKLNRLVRQIDPTLKVTQYFHDGQGNRTKIIDRNGNTTQFQYDLRQRLVKTTDALPPPKNVTTFTYDGNDNRISVIDKNNHGTHFDYDVQNRLTSVTDALNNISTMTYDPVGNLETETDANGHTTSYDYDALNRRIRKTDAIPAVTQWEYDTAGTPVCAECTGPTRGSNLVTKLIDGNGKTTHFKYDGLDRLVKQVRKEGDLADAIDPSDAVTTNTYDAHGNRLTMTEPNGNPMEYVYDGLHRQTTVTNAAGDTTIRTYDPASNVKTVTAPNGNVTTYAYDALDRRIRVDDSAGLVATYTYDFEGNRLTDKDGNGNGTTNQYDAIYRLKRVNDALNRPTLYDYDPVGNLIRITDREGKITSYAYDAINRRKTLTDALGNPTDFDYDRVGNLVRITDANGNPTQYEYDDGNRMIKETYADHAPNTRTFTYDLVGHLTSRTDQKGQTTTYAYDDLYFLRQRDYPLGPGDHFTYDTSGRMLSAERGGRLVTFSYDGANRVTHTTQDAQGITYAYDIPGRTRTLTYPGGRTIVEHTDARSRIDHIDDPALAPATIAHYDYDFGNRVVSRAYRNGTAATYSHNANNWILRLVHTHGANPIAAFGYAFDNEGNKRFEAKEHDPGHSEAYRYDNTHRLIDYKVGALVGSTVPVSVTQTQYDLDPVGNWKQKVKDAIPEARTHNAANEITAIGDTPIQHDDNGNLSEDARYRYAYDEENRLASVTRKLDGKVVSVFRYDALSRRVGKIADPTFGPSAPTETRYFFDQARIVEEQSAAGATSATYVYGNYVDEVLTMDRGGQSFYYHQNALWSVAAITDGTGSVLERYAYDAYGLPAITDGAGVPVASTPWGTSHSAIGNPWMFTARQGDEETGLYFYRARYYDPDKGRFIQRDPIGYADGSNLYEYVKTRPTRFRDPFGFEACDCCCRLFIRLVYNPEVPPPAGADLARHLTNAKALARVEEQFNNDTRACWKQKADVEDVGPGFEKLSKLFSDTLEECKKKKTECKEGGVVKTCDKLSVYIVGHGRKDAGVAWPIKDPNPENKNRAVAGQPVLPFEDRAQDLPGGGQTIVRGLKSAFQDITELDMFACYGAVTADQLETKLREKIRATGYPENTSKSGTRPREGQVDAQWE